MAAAKLPFQIALEQNTNDDSTAFGKWFGRTYSTSDTLSLRGLIERVAFDQSVYSRDIIEGVIDRLTTVMTELLTSGESVKWDGLGTFTPYVESTGTNDVESYDVNVNVKGIHIRFIPPVSGRSATSPSATRRRWCVSSSPWRTTSSTRSIPPTTTRAVNSKFLILNS